MQLVLSGPARRDMVAIVRWSVRHFGESAALRYEALIVQALRDIAADPERLGAARSDLMVQGARTYHLVHSRTRVPEPRVKTPRHLIVYRYVPGSGIVVARILHDSRDLVRHLPSEYRR